MKKLASLILALAMCLALGAPAFAGETSMTGNLTSELTSMLPELKLTLPDSARIILNPYRNTVANDTATASTGIDKGDRLQVMNPVFSITSTTTNKVHVAATVTGSTGGNAEFSSAVVNPGEGGHKVYLTLTYALSKGATASVPAPDKVSGATNVKVISDSEIPLEWDIPACTGTAVADTQRLDMQFGGSCSDTPSADDGPWTESDTVSCAFVFTATPVTDAPMIPMVYQPGGTVAAPTYTSELIITTTPPADFKSNPSIEKIEYGAPGATPLTDLPDTDDDMWDGSSWSSNGKTLTIKGTALGATVLPAATSNANKIVKVTLGYKDNSSPQVDKTVEYTIKVTVLAVPAS